MKTGRNVHVPKSSQMKQLYRRYIDSLDYEPTVDDRLNFGQSSQGGEELATAASLQSRPVGIGDKIKDHFSNNWVVWVLAALAAGIFYLISDSKVAFTRFDTLLTTHSERIIDLKNSVEASQKNAHSQDLKIQENRMKIDHLQSDVSRVQSRVDKIIELQRGNVQQDSSKETAGQTDKPVK